MQSQFLLGCCTLSSATIEQMGFFRLSTLDAIIGMCAAATAVHVGRRARATDEVKQQGIFGMRATHIALSTIAFLIVPLTLIPVGRAQWRVRTPRDTVVVPANRSIFTYSHNNFSLASYVTAEITVRGTFSALPGQTAGKGFDPAYLYEDTAWKAAQLPLFNPPSWQGTKYNIYLSYVSTGRAADEQAVFSTPPGYQSAHIYKSRVQCGSTNLWFRVYDRLVERPDGYYYGQNVGADTISMAQFTAGICVMNKNINFGVVDVGSQQSFNDSLACYGLDPLQIDSIWIDGADARCFRFISSRGNKFSLSDETAGEVRVIYTPDSAVPASATLHIRSSNCELPARLQNIALVGSGASPKQEFGTHALDFNRVRVNTTDKQYVVVYNTGTAKLIFDKIYLDAASQALGVFATNGADTIPAKVGLRIPITFTPRAQKTYSGTVYFHSPSLPLDSVSLKGEGAMPIVSATQTQLDFGTVRSYGSTVVLDTVLNTGNWTANITKVALSGASAFSFVPNDQQFLLDAGASRPYQITFNPGTLTNTKLTATLRFYFDDASEPLVIQLIGNEKKPEILYDSMYVGPGKALNFGKVKMSTVKWDTVGVLNSSAINTPFTPTYRPNGNDAPVWRTFRIDTVLKSAPWFMYYPGQNGLRVGFRPHDRGEFSGWMKIAAADQNDSIFCYGYGAQAFPIFSPKSLDYPTALTGTQNFQLLTLRDTGDLGLNVCDIKIDGPDAADFSISRISKPNGPFNQPLPTTVDSSGTDILRIGINFTPTERRGGQRHAWVKVYYCDGSVDSVALNGAEAEQHLQFSQSKIDFGKVHVSTPVSAHVGFTNGTNVTIPVDTMWITPAGNPFTLAATSTSVAANKQDSSIAISFTPPAHGPWSAMLHAKSASWQDSIPVTGFGLAPMPALVPTQVILDTTDVGVKSGIAQFTLADTGDWLLRTTIEKSNDRFGEFVVTLWNSDTVNPTAVDTVAIGEKHYYSVIFTPKRPELPDHRALLTFTYEDGSKQTVTLIGHDRYGNLTLEMDTLNFGKVRIGATPATLPLKLVNTSNLNLTAKSLQMPSAPFGLTPSGAITVAAGENSVLTASFAPTTIGTVQSSVKGIGMPFSDTVGNTTVLTGIGAAPVPVFSRDTIDFGILTVGTPAIRSLGISNTGNWPMMAHWTISGANAADFSSLMASDTTISDGDAANADVTFAATTPLQLTPRTATLTYTLADDPNASYSVTLVAHDKAPMQVPVTFSGNYGARPGDQIFAFLRLGSNVPDSIGLKHVHGTITFDPNVVELIGREQGSLVPAPIWTVPVTDTLSNHGSIEFDISSSSDTLRIAGPLLKLTFKMRDNLQPGATTLLTVQPEFPDTKEAIAVSAPSVIYLDSVCSQSHFTAGIAFATFIQQNTPNPFGSASPTTELPFDVGEDNTPITIRVLDVTGHEVYRPLDRAIYAHGHYSVPINIQNVGNAGTFFYEFVGGAQAPQIKKMMVQ
jgi:hypothetical protein